MEQIILHGIGDYILQNDFQALNKKKRGIIGLTACLMHCLLYSTPFLLIGSFNAVLIIFTTHFFIDRTKFVDYFLALRNNVRTNKKLDITNFGFSKERPQIITIWLYIITDNLLHIICNYLALKYF